MTSIVFRLMLLGGILTALACGPDVPDDAVHRAATETDCLECHFYGDGGEPSDRHWDGDEPKASYEDCLSCHDRD